MSKNKKTELKRSDLSENMKNILAILQDNKTRSTREIYQSLAIPVTTLRKALNRLHLFELVDEVQNRNGNVWTITKKGLMLADQKEETNKKEENQTSGLNGMIAEMDHLIEAIPQEESDLLPNKKEAKTERFTSIMLSFWLRTKAKELADMAEFVESNKDSINVQQ